MYSASIVESATVSCFELFQLTTPPFRRKTNPDCDRESSLSVWKLASGFNNLLEQDDKGDVSAETTGPAPAEVSAGIQISAERLLCYWLIPKSE
ncbi:hypothetical protein V6N13_081092 [Hibiscus sabdariffa]